MAGLFQPGWAIWDASSTTLSCLTPTQYPLPPGVSNAQTDKKACLSDFSIASGLRGLSALWSRACRGVPCRARACRAVGAVRAGCACRVCVRAGGRAVPCVLCVRVMHAVRACRASVPCVMCRARRASGPCMLCVRACVRACRAVRAVRAGRACCACVVGVCCSVFDIASAGGGGR